MLSLSEKDRANLATGIAAILKIQSFVIVIKDADEVGEIVQKYLPQLKLDLELISNF